jgi:hypothetical protein
MRLFSIIFTVHSVTFNVSSSSSLSFTGLLAQNTGQSEIENILQQLKEGKNVSQGLKVQ